MRWTRVLTFFAITVALTQGVGALLVLLRGPARKGDMFEFGLRANLSMLVPGIVAIAFARFVLREPARKALGWRFRPNLWWLLAWLLPAILAGIVMHLRLLAPGAELGTQKGPWSFVPMPTQWAVLAAGLLAGVSICLPGALGEELAWRGLLRRELEPLGFWPSSLVIGLLWAAWHMPSVIFGTTTPTRQPLGLTLMLLLQTPVALVLCGKGRSVMAAALFHSSGSAMLASLMIVKGGDGLLAVSAKYLPALVCLLIVVAFPGLRRGREDLHVREKATIPV